MQRINDAIACARKHGEIACPGGAVKPEVFIVTDLAALRHCEHLAGSGFCGCSQDFALRQSPAKKPASVAEMHALLRQCRCPTAT